VGGRRRRWRRWGEGGGKGERPEVHEGVGAFIGKLGDCNFRKAEEYGYTGTV